MFQIITEKTKINQNNSKYQVNEVCLGHPRIPQGEKVTGVCSSGVQPGFINQAYYKLKGFITTLNPGGLNQTIMVYEFILVFSFAKIIDNE